VKAEVMVKEEVKVKIKDKVEKTSGFPFAPAYRRQVQAGTPSIPVQTGRATFRSE
jgi:hypothetical protein